MPWSYNLVWQNVLPFIYYCKTLHQIIVILYHSAKVVGLFFDRRWKYTCFIMCQFQVYSKVIYLYVYICLFFLRFSSNFSSVQSLGGVRLFPTPWRASPQVSLSITNSRSLLKLMSIESEMPSNYCILCHPLLLLPSNFPTSRSFPMSQFFTSGGQSIAVSASTSVFPMNIQD